MLDHMEHCPLEGGIGVELGFDFDRALPPGEVEQLRDLYHRYHLLLVRGARIDRAAQMRFMGHLGPVIQRDTQGYISNIRPDITRDNELKWHSDLIWTPEPHQGISLYARVADEGVSPTRFVDAERALNTLPADLRRAIEGREVVHISGGRGSIARDMARVPHEAMKTLTRPIVLRNPQTGRDVLGVAVSQASHIVDMPPDESAALLDALFDHLYQNEYIHVWRTDDLLVWDNFALQHARDALTGGGRRDLERVLIGGRTVWEQYPEWMTLLDKQLAERSRELQNA